MGSWGRGLPGSTGGDPKLSQSEALSQTLGRASTWGRDGADKIRMQSLSAGRVKFYEEK